MEKIEETIKEIAIKHGVAVNRDDPILILHTINERLMKETMIAQRQILHEFKEELEAVANEWEVTTKKTAERILDVALTASKEAIAEGGKQASESFGREVGLGLVEANVTLRKARMFNMLSMVSTLVALLLSFIILLAGV